MIFDSLLSKENNKEFVINTANNGTGLTFTAIQNLNYNRSCKVASEPLEDGTFSNDSIQNSGYTLNLTGILQLSPKNRSEYRKFTNEYVRTQIGDCIDLLEQFTTGYELLFILFKRPFFKAYNNMKLVSFDYAQNESNISTLVAYMSFQEIRLTDTTFSGLSMDNLTNKTNSSSIDSGVIASKVVDKI